MLLRIKFSVKIIYKRTCTSLKYLRRAEVRLCCKLLKCEFALKSTDDKYHDICDHNSVIGYNV